MIKAVEAGGRHDDAGRHEGAGHGHAGPDTNGHAPAHERLPRGLLVGPRRLAQETEPITDCP